MAQLKIIKDESYRYLERRLARVTDRAQHRRRSGDWECDLLLVEYAIMELYDNRKFYKAEYLQGHLSFKPYRHGS